MYLFIFIKGWRDILSIFFTTDQITKYRCRQGGGGGHFLPYVNWKEYMAIFSREHSLRRDICKCGLQELIIELW